MRKGAVHGIGRGWIFQPGDAVSSSSVLAFPNASIKAVGLVWAVVVVVLCVRSVWTVVGVGLFVGLVRSGVDFDLVDMLVRSGVYLPSIDEWYRGWVYPFFEGFGKPSFCARN